MQKFEGHFYFASVSKTIGLKGELLLKNVSDECDFNQKIEFVFFSINKQLTPYLVEKVTLRKKGEALLKIQGIDRIEQTPDFLRKDIYLPDALKLKKEEGFIEFKDLIGFSVTDKNYGNIGIISQVLSYPQQEIFEINFNGKEILLPANEEFIEKINLKNKLVKVNAPAGLIDLYLETEKNNASDEEE